MFFLVQYASSIHTANNIQTRKSILLQGSVEVSFLIRQRVTPNTTQSRLRAYIFPQGGLELSLHTLLRTCVAIPAWAVKVHSPICFFLLEGLCMLSAVHEHYLSGGSLRHAQKHLIFICFPIIYLFFRHWNDKLRNGY